MSSADNENKDLGLALGNSENCTRIRMNESSGAGVNAGSSSVNLKFPASDSLSELVWSPHKGLSVKCAAEGGLADKRSFLLWNVGPSNVDPSAFESIRCKGNDDDDKIVAANLVISQAELRLDSPVAPRASLTESPLAGGSNPGLNMESKDEMEEGKNDVRVLAISRTQSVHHLEVRDPAKQQEDYLPETSKNDAGLLIPNLSLQVRPDSNCDIAEAEASSVNLNKGIPSDPNHTNDNAVINCQILEVGSRAAVGQNPQCLDMHTEELKAANDEEEKTKFSTHGGYMVPCGGNLEYTAENDLQQATEKDAYQQSEERLVRGCSLPLDIDAENHSSHFDQFKGKDKALSEGNVSRRFLDNEDDSQGSVESCHSACLLGKRRWNSSEQLMVDSKRMKNNIDANIASTSMIRHDSSFLNWISNMVNGFSKVNQEDGPSLDLTLAHPTHEDTSIIPEDVMCSRMQDAASRNRGFQTVFQSLYCPSTKLLESGASENDCSAQGPHVQIDNTDVHISPVGLPGQNGVSYNHDFTSDEMILPSTEDIVGQPDQALILSAVTPIQNGFKADSAENKESSYQECRKYKNGTSASVFLADPKITMADNVIPPHAFDGRAACELSNKGKIFGSLWIARFATKVCSTSLNLDNSKKDDCPAIWSPDDFTAPNPQSQIMPDLLNGDKCPDISNKSSESMVGLGKELQTVAANTESSLGSKIMHEDSYQNHAELAHKSRTSEAIASTFARRLDALKHIIPTVLEADSSSRVLTCFFCGKNGHNFQTCSEVTGTKLVKTVSNKQKSNGKECSGNRSLSSNKTKNQMNSNCMENKAKEHKNLSLISLVSVDIAEAPKGVFEAVRRLQVSRADMLKWINSNVSLAHLEGLFLRLRLGKWEAGLGGTGYYVARIIVENSGELLKDFKKSISVNVGGMKCLVGSQYISNHDFLEDELQVWWRRILKTGGEVPSKEDLDSRLKSRITLGF